MLRCPSFECLEGDQDWETDALISSPGHGAATLGEAQQAATERAQGWMLLIAVSFACIGGALDVALTHYGLGAVGWAVCTFGALLVFTIGALLSCLSLFFLFF